MSTADLVPLALAPEILAAIHDRARELRALGALSQSALFVDGPDVRVVARRLAFEAIGREPLDSGLVLVLLRSGIAQVVPLVFDASDLDEGPASATAARTSSEVPS